MNFWTAWLQMLCFTGVITTFSALSIILAAWIIDNDIDEDEEDFIVTKDGEEIKFNEDDQE